MKKHNREKHIFKFIRPSESLIDTLPSGNGENAICVYGNPRLEKITFLNYKMFSCRRSIRKHVLTLKSIYKKVKSFNTNKLESLKLNGNFNKFIPYNRTINCMNCLKEKMQNKQYMEAEHFLSKIALQRGFSNYNYNFDAICDLKIDFGVSSQIKNYYRAVDTNTGEIEVSFEDRRGFLIRDYFVSIKKNLTAMKFYCIGNRFVDCSCLIELKNKNSHIELDKNILTYVSSKYDMTFGMVMKIICNSGTIEKLNNGFIVKGANYVEIFCKTFVYNNEELIIRKLEKSIKEIQNINSYDTLFREQEILQHNLINRSMLNIYKTKDKNIEDLLLNLDRGVVEPVLLEKLFIWGKYLFFCYYKFLSNSINIQDLFATMIFALKNNHLSFVQDFIISFYNSLQTYKNNAKRLFNLDGCLIPLLKDNEGNFSNIDISNLLNFTMGANICSIIYNFYIFTRDKNFIEKYCISILESIGLFYKNFFILNSKSGTFETSFGVSSFSKVNNSYQSIATNCMCDFVSAKYAFFVLSKLNKFLGREDKGNEWQELYNKIPDYSIDNIGIIKEYNSNFFSSSYNSPYISFLFPYNVGIKNFDAKRDFEILISNTAKYKYNRGIGNFTLTNLFELCDCLTACGDSFDAFEILSTILKNFLNKNLTFASFDFLYRGVSKCIDRKSLNQSELIIRKNIDCELINEQINSFFYNCDKNIRLVNIIQNMFINICQNNIYLFQTIPLIFQRGHFYGIQLNKYISVNIDFNVSRGKFRVKFISKIDTSINLILPPKTYKIRGVDNQSLNKREMSLRGVVLYKNKPLKIRFLVHI